MKLVIDIPEDRYETLKMLSENRTFYLDFYQRLIVNGTPLPEGAEILTKEAYSDLCLRASRTPCYLGSPCEYQNPEVKLPETANPDVIADLKIIAEALVAIIDKECCDYGYHIAYDKAEKWLGESEDGTD